jgi:hypothetical protein
MTKAPTIIQEASDITSGARNAAYGTPEDNFKRIARLWTAYLQNKGIEAEVSASDVGAMMRLMKEARIQNTPDHRDSFVDLIGYAICQARCEGIE